MGLYLFNSLWLHESRGACLSELWVKNDENMAPKIRKNRAKKILNWRINFSKTVPKSFLLGPFFFENPHRSEITTHLHTFLHERGYCSNSDTGLSYLEQPYTSTECSMGHQKQLLIQILMCQLLFSADKNQEKTVQGEKLIC